MISFIITSDASMTDDPTNITSFIRLKNTVTAYHNTSVYDH